MGKPKLEVVRDESSSGGRWYLYSVFDEWPHRTLIRKFPTKRAANAIRDIYLAGHADKTTAMVFLDDALKSSVRVGLSTSDARQNAAESFRSLLDGTVPQPSWWQAWAAAEQEKISAGT